MSPKEHVDSLADELREHFLQIVEANAKIRRLLEAHSDGKKLKGDEIVGWVGEIYGKLLLGGALVPDVFEHDFDATGMRVSVKTRKGWGAGFTQTSAIPSIEGEGCPTHLMFVHLNDDFSPDRIWMYPWKDLIRSRRFKPHVVRGNVRSLIFRAVPSLDAGYLVYPAATSVSAPSKVAAPSSSPLVTRSQSGTAVAWSAEKAVGLKARRKALGLSQQQVGDITGIGRRRYSWIEYPKIVVPPTRDELERISRVLKLESGGEASIQ